MASLVGQQLKDTYDSLLKTSDNDALGGTYKEITDGSGNGSNLYLGTSGSIGIGTGNPSSLLHLENSSSPALRIKDTTNNVTLLAYAQDDDAHVGTYSNHDLIFDSNSTERLRIDSSGNITHSGTSPQYIFKTASNTNFQIAVQENVANALEITPSTTAGGTTFSNPALVVNSSGNVLVGKTATGRTTVGHEFHANGFARHTALEDKSLEIVRTSTDGEMVEFFKDSTQVGSIASVATGKVGFFGSGGSGVVIDSSGNVGIGATSVTSGFRTEIAGGDFRVGDTQGEDAVEIGWSSGGSQGFVQAYDRGDSAFRNLMLNNYLLIESGGNISFFEDTGSTQKLGWSASNERLSLTGSDYQFELKQGSNQGYFLRAVSDGSFRIHLNGTGDIFSISSAGASSFAGSLAKGSGSFKIDHPLESKKDTHHLVHSFVESPQANNIYRGSVTLSDGQATVNLDEVSTMTEGTFVALNTSIHVYTSNESDWDAVKGSVSDNVLTIECQNASSTAKVNWLVIGERQDQHMIDTEWTDKNGKVIVEPLK